MADVSCCEVLVDKEQFSGAPSSEETHMGLLAFSLNVTLDGCLDHQEGIAADETHTFFRRLIVESGTMLWSRTS